MKLILQIAFGVFLGTVAAQLTLDSWHTHQANLTQATTQQRLAEQERTRQLQGERIRTLIMQSQQQKPQNANNPPVDFVPDDAPIPGSP